MCIRDRIYVDAAWAPVPEHAERDLDSWREKERPSRSLFLARRNGQPVGWVAGRLLASGRGYISALAVATRERGRGLGRGLLLHAVADLQRTGARDVTLGVEAQTKLRSRSTAPSTSRSSVSGAST